MKWKTCSIMVACTRAMLDHYVDGPHAVLEKMADRALEQALKPMMDSDLPDTVFITITVSDQPTSAKEVDG
jgi:hypothetical protein